MGQFVSNDAHHKRKTYWTLGGPNSLQLIDIVDNLEGKLYIMVGDLGYILLVGNLVPSTQSSTSHPLKFSLFTSNTFVHFPNPRCVYK
jgi:hypothetical protein